MPNRLNRDVPKPSEHKPPPPPPPPTPPPKPEDASPTPSGYYYKEIVQTTPSTYDIPTVPNILKFYSSDATGYQGESSGPEYYQEFSYRPSGYEENADEGYSDADFFPSFVTNTVSDFSSPAGEDGRYPSIYVYIIVILGM